MRDVFAARADADRYGARANSELEVFEADVVDRQAVAALIADHYDEDDEI